MLPCVNVAIKLSNLGKIELNQAQFNNSVLLIVIILTNLKLNLTLWILILKEVLEIMTSEEVVVEVIITMVVVDI